MLRADLFDLAALLRHANGDAERAASNRRFISPNAPPRAPSPPPPPPRPSSIKREPTTGRPIATQTRRSAPRWTPGITARVPQTQRTVTPIVNRACTMHTRLRFVYVLARKHARCLGLGRRAGARACEESEREKRTRDRACAHASIACDVSDGRPAIFHGARLRGRARIDFVARRAAEWSLGPAKGRRPRVNHGTSRFAETRRFRGTTRNSQIKLRSVAIDSTAARIGVPCHLAALHWPSVNQSY